MLDLHENLKARLTTSLSTALPEVKVNNAMFVDSGSRLPLIALDQSLPDHGILRDRLSGYIDPDFPGMIFVYDSLQYELMINEYSQDNSQKLTEIVGFEDAAAHANRLVAAFNSLPWRYVFSIPLPSDVSELLAKFVVDEQLGPNIRLVKATKEFSDKYPLNHPDKKRHASIHRTGLLFPTPDDVSYRENRIYIQIEAQGFIGAYGGTAPAIQAERLLKSFLGLGLALRLLKVADVYSISPPTHSFFVHKAERDTWAIHTKIDLDRDTSRVFDQLRSSDMFKGVSEERKLYLAKLIVDELRAVFSAGDKAEPVTLGAGWLFESYGVQDRRLSYVQSMVVLEVLLGDKATSDVIGLGQLLRNRCAYLIGKSHDERRTLLKDFDELYAVRSQIVHRGKATLNFKERLLSDKLRDICNRVIQREVDLLRQK